MIKSKASLMIKKIIARFRESFIKRCSKPVCCSFKKDFTQSFLMRRSIVREKPIVTRRKLERARCNESKRELIEVADQKGIRESLMIRA